MSLKDVGGEEEYLEYDCQGEERKPIHKQPEALDLLEEGKFCSLRQSDPFPLKCLCRPGCFTDLTAVFYFRSGV